MAQPFRVAGLAMGQAATRLTLFLELCAQGLRKTAFCH
jgi:hypothetical protein